jgi:hypothetical protein
MKENLMIYDLTLRIGIYNSNSSASLQNVQSQNLKSAIGMVASVTITMPAVLVLVISDGFQLHRRLIDK